MSNESGRALDLEVILNSPKRSILDNLPRNHVDIDRIMRDMEEKTSKGERFSLKDDIPQKAYTVETYRLGKAREYVTVVMGIKPGKSCMRPIEPDEVASKNTCSMRDAIQLHYDAVGYFKKLK